MKSLDDIVERIRIELPTLLPIKDDKVGHAYLGLTDKHRLTE